MLDPMDFFATAPVKSPQEVIREQMRGMPTPAPAAPTKKVVKSSSISNNAKNDAEGNPAPQPVSGQEMLPRAVAAQKRPIAAQSDGSGDQREDYGSDLYSRRAKMEEELASTLGDPDYSKMTQYAKDRSERGERDLMLAMAAGLGGEETKPIGAMFLKQAAEARNPIKVATGLIDENGQYIEDAEAVQERKGKRIDARIKSIDTLISSNIAAQDKIRLARERNDLMLMMKNMSLAAGAGGRSDKADQAKWRFEDQLSKQYDASTKDIRMELDATRKMNQLAPTMIGRRPNAIEQQTMIILLNKFLDPTSVVREGEFDRVAQAQGYVQRAQNLQNRIANGELMSDKLISQIVDMGKFYEKAAQTKLQGIGDQYYEKAGRRDLDPTSIVVDPNYRPRGAQAPAAMAPPPAGAVREKGAPAVREVTR